MPARHSRSVFVDQETDTSEEVEVTPVEEAQKATTPPPKPEPTPQPTGRVKGVGGSYKASS